MAATAVQERGLVDGFGRHISYVRLSVTDRCDLRCLYCMGDDMQFAPRDEVLRFEEIETLADILIARGVKRIRLTGGEPLVRRDIGALAARLGARLGEGGLDELTLTTNGTRLAAYAKPLHDAGIRRINVSLDSRDPERFRTITRHGDIREVLAGIDAARAAGLRVKINMVALKGLNAAEIAPMLRWCADEGHDLALIETMNLGEVAEDRSLHYLPLDQVKSALEQDFTLLPSTHRTGGPARYYEVEGIRLGLITPLTGNFCEGCNRVRVTATGSVYACLGHDRKVELRAPLRAGDTAAVHAALDALLAAKPERHDFRIGAGIGPAVARHMNVTGG